MNVTLFRDHPAENWPSMDRYAESLWEGLEQMATPGWQFTMPLPPTSGKNVYQQQFVRLMQYPGWAKRRQEDINHILDHSYGHVLNRLDPFRTVVTVHDVSPLRFPGQRWGISGFIWRWAWRGVSRARHIIVVSEFSEQETRKHLPDPDISIHVVPQGVASHFQRLPESHTATLRSRYVQPDTKLLLHVGNTQARKNVSGVLKSLALLHRTGMRAVLIQAGGIKTEPLSQLIRALDLSSSVHFLGSVSEGELVAYYNAADLLVFPSFYEGFGLPVLEAMACGTPVLTSNVASLPEVAGRAAILVDPANPQAIADAALEVLSSPERLANLRALGLERATQFTWNETARKTLAVYQSIAETLRTH